MTRRELLKALSFVLPAGVTASVISDVNPTDILVIRSRKLLSQQARENLRIAVTAMWKGPSPAPTVLVFDDGIRLQRLRRP